jgi:predicted transcriptional regulator
MNEIIKKKKSFNDPSVSPVIRQVLLHWGYELTKKDFDAYKKLLKKKS